MLMEETTLEAENYGSCPTTPAQPVMGQGWKEASFQTQDLALKFQMGEPEPSSFSRAFPNTHQVPVLTLTQYLVQLFCYHL